MGLADPQPNSSAFTFGDECRSCDDDLYPPCFRRVPLKIAWTYLCCHSRP